MNLRTLFSLLAGSFLFLVANGGIRAAEQGLPPEAESAFQRGIAAANQKEWKLAIKYFNEARYVAPTHPSVLFNLALAYDRSGGTDLVAIIWFKAYLAAAPNASNADQVRKQVYDLEVRVESTIQKLVRNAKEAIERTLEGKNKNHPYYNLVAALATVGDIAGAKETTRRILEESARYSALDRIAYSKKGSSLLLALGTRTVSELPNLINVLTSVHFPRTYQMKSNAVRLSD